MLTWTYTLPLNRPDWVRECTRFCGTVLLLVRRSGDQEIKLGESICRDAGGEIEHHVQILRFAPGEGT